MCGNKIFCFSHRVRGEESNITKHNRVKAIKLRYISALSHNAIYCGKTLLLLKVIAVGIESRYRYS
jgi:hypothetical protein